MSMIVTGWTDSIAARQKAIKTVSRLDSVHTLLALPRYDEFRNSIRRLAGIDDGVRITEIAGNRQILLTGVATKDWRNTDVGARVLYELPLPSDSLRKRVAMQVSVNELLPVMRRLGGQRAMVVDHIYDY
jgi:hypothetical protein